MKNAVYILDAKRTPVGKYGGSLLHTPATDLAAIVIQSLLKSSPAISKNIDEIIIGNVLSAGLGQNPARIAAIKSGLNKKIPAYIVNKVCGSGLQSIIIGTYQIQSGNAQLILAGGMENMSRAPYLVENHRFGAKLGHHTLKDSMMYDGLFCSLIGESMGVTAENIAKKYKISRKNQDEYALNSHKKALSAKKNGIFKEEIVPVTIKNGKETISFLNDEQPRENTSIEALGKLDPVFKQNGTVTAGNSSSLNDAASAILIASEQFIKKHTLKPMAKIISFSSVGLDPAYMGLGAYYAAKKALSDAHLNPRDIDLWEINEAFASQTLAVLQLLRITEEKVNVHGGALALGHPIGASGSRILTTLIHELKRRKGKYGVATLCIGGGQGVAMVIENI